MCVNASTMEVTTTVRNTVSELFHSRVECFLADGAVAFNVFAFRLEDFAEEWRDAQKVFVDREELLVFADAELSSLATEPVHVSVS